MMSELVDIVNEKDEVVGKGTRELVHQNGALHRVVHLIIETSDRKFVIQKRATGRKLLDLAVGGHVSHGDSYVKTVKREAKEEIGLDAKIVELIGFVKSTDNTKNHIGAVFYCKSDGPFTINKEEVDELFYYSKQDLEHLICVAPRSCTNGLKEAFRFYSSYKQKELVAKKK